MFIHCSLFAKFGTPRSALPRRMLITVEFGNPLN